jgi:hypothetical protein
MRARSLSMFLASGRRRVVKASLDRARRITLWRRSIINFDSSDSRYVAQTQASIGKAR